VDEKLRSFSFKASVVGFLGPTKREMPKASTTLATIGLVAETNGDYSRQCGRGLTLYVYVNNLQNSKLHTKAPKW